MILHELSKSEYLQLFSKMQAVLAESWKGDKFSMLLTYLNGAQWGLIRLFKKNKETDDIEDLNYFIILDHTMWTIEEIYEQLELEMDK